MSRMLSRCTDRKLRLLCLHGMYQDAVTFMDKTKHLHGINSNVELIFLDGPFITVPPILARQNKRPSTAFSKMKHIHSSKKKMEFRAWWRLPSIHQENSRNLERDRDMLINFLREKLDEIGDVDGVVGFSQGASLAAWMCSEQVRVNESKNEEVDEAKTLTQLLLTGLR